MGHILAKIPQQRIRAGEKHPTVVKLEKLFDFMDELGIDLSSYYGIFVIDCDRPQDKEWEIRDIVNSKVLTDLPCNAGEYKITRDIDVPPRDAQPAPKSPKKKKIVPKRIVTNNGHTRVIVNLQNKKN